MSTGSTEELSYMLARVTIIMRFHALFAFGALKASTWILHFGEHLQFTAAQDQVQPAFDK